MEDKVDLDKNDFDCIARNFEFQRYSAMKLKEIADTLWNPFTRKKLYDLTLEMLENTKNTNTETSNSIAKLMYYIKLAQEVLENE